MYQLLEYNMHDFVESKMNANYLQDRAYTKEQILQKEKDILVALKFRISMPTTYCFILRYLKVIANDCSLTTVDR